MTEQELDAIRARCEAATELLKDSPDVEACATLWKTIGAEAVDRCIELFAERDHLAIEVMKLKNELVENDIKYNAEREQWKAREEILKRGIPKTCETCLGCELENDSSGNCKCWVYSGKPFSIADMLSGRDRLAAKVEQLKGELKRAIVRESQACIEPNCLSIVHVRKDRDRWKARAEALEWALKNHACEPCEFCVNSERRGHVDVCDDCVVWCGCPGAPDKFLFDEARFAATAGGENG